MLELLLWVCSSSSKSWPFLSQQWIQLVGGTGDISSRATPSCVRICFLAVTMGRTCLDWGLQVGFLGMN